MSCQTASVKGAGMNEEKQEEKKVERLGYTVKDLAAALGISARSVLCALDRGELKAKKIGRNWIVSRKEVDKWLS